MKKTKNLKVEIIQECITNVVCNKCGKSCSTGNVQGNKVYDRLLSAIVSGSYYTKKLGDMTRYEFDMCEVYLAKLFKTFKIPCKIEQMG